jgi:hypothetical protein
MTRTTLKYFLIIIISSAALFFVLQQASAYFNPLGPTPWPRDSITYYNNSGYSKTLEMAVSQWNRADIPVNFEETDSRDNADLVINDDYEELQASCDTSQCLGHADVGYKFWKQASVHLMPATGLENQVVDFSELPIIIHELGHIIGLKHSDDPCSIMNSSSICRKIADTTITGVGSFSVCGPWADDLSAIADLYDYDFVFEQNRRSVCYDQTATTAFWNQVKRKLTTRYSLYSIIRDTKHQRATDQYYQNYLDNYLPELKQ